MLATLKESVPPRGEGRAAKSGDDNREKKNSMMCEFVEYCRRYGTGKIQGGWGCIGLG